MRVLIVGVGSIAIKHIAALQTLAPQVEIFGLRSSTSSPNINGISDIYSWSDVPTNLDFIIISNPTTEHYNAILKAIRCKVPLMIEKPPLANFDGSEEIIEQLERNDILNYVAFSLRFNPVIKWLKGNLAVKDVYELNAYCGSYLPDWRPNRDYSEIYSAKKVMGGGVHLDLIHELDFVTWLLGPPSKSSSFFSKISDLNIDSYDCAHYWLTYADKNAAITLNYYKKNPCREITIVKKDDTWTANLLLNEVQDSLGNILFKADPSNQSIYLDQMEYFLNCIKNNKVPFKSFRESIETLKLCLS